MVPHGNTETRWSSVWNPTTNRSLVSEFMAWLSADVEKANANRAKVRVLCYIIQPKLRLISTWVGSLAGWLRPQSVVHAA